jgi:two-component system response regulator YesN
MSNIKVMIVDDEILAIEYIRGLIDWTKSGYEIVATQTQPLKVAECIRKTRPDLIMIDIVMPGMDGLELSKRLLLEFPYLKIILLTSYKDFEYAKTAIKLGVSNYLVKHELDALSLQEELHRLKQELQSERQKQHDELETLLLHWFRGEQLHQILPLQVLISWHKQWQIILLKANTAFSWLEPLSNEDHREWKKVNFKNELRSDSSQQLLLAIPIQQRFVLLLYGITDIVSIKKQKELLETELLFVKNILGEINPTTYSSALVSQVSKIENIPYMIKAAFDQLELSFFYGAEEVFRIGQENDFRPVQVQAYEEDYELIKLLMQDGRYEEAAKAIEALFVRLRHGYDVSGLRRACTELYTLLNRQYISLIGTSLASQVEQEIIAAPYFSSYDELLDWFSIVIQRFVDINLEKKGLSRKVRTALEYVELHYADREFQIERLAQELGVSSDHLRHLFKEELGLTLHDKLTEIRIQHAKRLLRVGKLKVYQIAECVGYRESRYFSQVFRKHTGFTPQEYMDRSR